jgi:hypothetical protein
METCKQFNRKVSCKIDYSSDYGWCRRLEITQSTIGRVKMFGHAKIDQLHFGSAINDHYIRAFHVASISRKKKYPMRPKFFNYQRIKSWIFLPMHYVSYMHVRKCVDNLLCYWLYGLFAETPKCFDMFVERVARYILHNQAHNFILVKLNAD